MDYLVEQLRYELREDPSSRVFFRLGEHLRREGELAEAVGILRAGLEHHPRYVAAWVSLGRALLGSGDDRGASEALARALELDPENGVASRYAGEAAIAGGEWVEAVKALKRARALSGQDDALDERILFVEQQLAENGQLEVPTPAPRRASAPPPAAADRVFPVDDADSGVHVVEEDVFSTASMGADDAPVDTDDAPVDDLEMDSRRTMAIPLDQIPIAPPPPTAEADAEAEAVFDLGAGEEPAPELEIVSETERAPEPEAVFETADRADDGASLEAGLVVGAVFETGTVAADWEAASDADADSDAAEDDDERSSSELRSEELPLPTMTLARLALDQGDLELAEKTLRGVLARNPGHSEASSLLATLAGSSGEGAPPPATDEPGTARVQALRRWLDAVRLASERLKT
jgi:tetratricopeptide (TPR) repeat protein